MTIVVYKCDTCKREIQLQQNPTGLEAIHRCIITHGCRGKLYQSKVLQDFIRGSLPDDVSGLDNWQQRKVLYNHSQVIQKQEWEIVHNLGTFPSFTVFVDRPIQENPNHQEEITPTDVIVIDKNTLRLTFDRPWSGIAQFVARASDPQLLQPKITTTQETIPPLQLSNLAELTIATRVSLGELSEIGIQLTYTTNTGVDIPINYVADDQPALNSSWRDFDKIVVRGKIYTVRSFSITTAQMATGDITSGSTVFVSGIDMNNDLTFTTPETLDALILLANRPGEIFDKITDKFIDISTFNKTQNPFSMFFNNGELFATSTIIQQTYPLIRSV